MKWIKKSIRATLISSLLLIAIYIFTLGLLATKGAIILGELREQYKKYQNDKLDEIWREESIKTFSQMDSFINEFNSLIPSAFINQVDPKQEINRALEIYTYLRPSLPAFLELIGKEKPQTFLVAFQNSAESRGTGGILGAFAIIEIRGTKLSVRQVGTNAALESLDNIPIAMSSEYISLYGSDPAIWQNSNLSPHFPYGAQIWLALWKNQFGEELDGVITLDPFVLKSLLNITGPIKVRNQIINASNIIAESLSDSYLRYEKDNLGRKQYLVEIIEEVAEALTLQDWPLRRAIYELATPLLEHRIFIYSADQTIQLILEKSQLSGVLPNQEDNEYRLVLQNTAGNKMDYYIKRKVILKSTECSPIKRTKVNFSVTNSASADSYLPAYVKGRLDLNLPQGQENSTSLTLMLYGPQKSELVSSLDSLSKEPVGYVKSERGRPILVIPVALSAGETRKFLTEFTGGVGPVSVHVQPLVIAQKTKILDKCR